MRPMTFLIDVDGCVLAHDGPASTQWNTMHRALDGVCDVLNELERRGHRIVLTTARPYRCKRHLEENLRHEGVVWHDLVMDMTGGVRVLVNDRKPDGQASCVARNSGLGGLLDEVYHRE